MSKINVRFPHAGPPLLLRLAVELSSKKKKEKKKKHGLHQFVQVDAGKPRDWLGVGRRGSLIGRQQALPLGVFQDGVVAEEVLVWGLDAEGPLAPHAAHRLPHVERADVLQLGQADVQGTERTWRSTAGARPSQRHTMTHLVGVNTI